MDRKTLTQLSYPDLNKLSSFPIASTDHLVTCNNLIAFYGDEQIKVLDDLGNVIVSLGEVGFNDSYNHDSWIANNRNIVIREDLVAWIDSQTSVLLFFFKAEQAKLHKRVKLLKFIKEQKLEKVIFRELEWASPRVAQEFRWVSPQEIEDLCIYSDKLYLLSRNGEINQYNIDPSELRTDSSDYIQISSQVAKTSKPAFICNDNFQNA